jgi:hypothetical protein
MPDQPTTNVTSTHAPETIWLQFDADGERVDVWDGITWCLDQINDTDVKYVRADMVKETT